MAGKLERVTGILQIRRYALVAAAGAAGLGAIYYLLSMAMLPEHVGTGMIDLPRVAAAVGLTAAVSGLGGINIAMIAYKMRRARARSAGSNSSAVFGGIFAAFTPGCPACTAPLALVLGAVGGLSLFPLQGLELKVLSAGVLAFSIYWIARGLQGQSCCRVR